MHVLFSFHIEKKNINSISGGVGGGGGGGSRGFVVGDWPKMFFPRGGSFAMANPHPSLGGGWWGFALIGA